MPSSRRETLKLLGGTGAFVAASEYSTTRYLTDKKTATALFTVHNAEAETEDGTIEDVFVTDGLGKIVWDGIDPTLIEIWLTAEPEDEEGFWGWDPIVTGDQIPDEDELAFTFDDLFAQPLALSDSPGGSIDPAIFELDEDENERRVTLQFGFEVFIFDDETGFAETAAEDTATVTVRRTGANDEPTASISRAEFELTVKT